MLKSTLCCIVCSMVVSSMGSGRHAAARTLSRAATGIDSTAPRRVSGHVVATFPVGTFLENLLVEANGDALVTSYREGKVYRVTPFGAVTTFATMPGTIAGIVARPTGGYLIVGWKDGKIPSVFGLSAAGRLETTRPLSGALFPNGIAHLAGTRYLIADSYRGVVWEFDDARGSSSVWLSDSLLTRIDTGNATPGVNGVRRSHDAVYLTSTQRGLIIRLPVDGRGIPAAPRVVMRGLNVDDLAIDDDGSLYVATHVVNTVVKVDTAGVWTTIGGLDEGLAGSTSVALLRTDRTRPRLLVTTNGGVTEPPPGGVQRARVVALDLVRRRRVAGSH